MATGLCNNSDTISHLEHPFLCIVDHGYMLDACLKGNIFEYYRINLQISYEFLITRLADISQAAEEIRGMHSLTARFLVAAGHICFSLTQ